MVVRGAPYAESMQLDALAGKSVGFVGGGAMAKALVRGLLQADAVAPAHIFASDKNPEREAELRAMGVQASLDNNQAAACDVVVIAVKPQIVDRVLQDIKTGVSSRTLIISVAAGITTRVLEAGLPAGARVVRAMPNTPAIVLAGATAIASGSHATQADVRQAEALFHAVGRTTVVDESLLDAVTGLSGSGPAYVMLIIEALADGGVKVGLDRETALMLAAQTVFGSAKLQLESGEHPGRLKDMVTSPGGTAIAGLHTLESGGLRRTLIDAVESATLRCKSLAMDLAQKGRP